YPFSFEQGDAFEWLTRDLSMFDLIWASPKCQGHSVLTPTEHKKNHEIQLPRVLNLLRAQPIPYIVENVEGAQQHMPNPVMLCGSMFGLDVWRHRWFELSNAAFFLLPPCDHSFAPVLISGSPRRGGNRTEPSTARRRTALETPWMTRTGMDQAIPPAYAKFLAEQISVPTSNYAAALEAW